MPADLVTGEDAVDVADYVAAVAGTPPQSSTVAGGTGAGQTTSTQQTTTEQTTTQQTTTRRRRRPRRPRAEAARAAGGDAAKGKALYTSLGCVGCHSLDGSKGTGPTFKGLYGQTVKLTNGQSVNADMEYLLASILDPDKQIVSGYSAGIMSAVIKRAGLAGRRSGARRVHPDAQVARERQKTNKPSPAGKLARTDASGVAWVGALQLLRFARRGRRRRA